jgi:hypothetical protein
MTDTTYILTQTAQSSGTLNNDFIEGLKIAATLSTPFIASFLTYWFAIRGKLKDTDIAKRNELNNVLSNLLIVWHYLTRLDDICKLKYEDKIILPIPKDYISFLLLKSGTLNDKSFQELDSSIINLKKYEPISFFELEGIGRRLEFLKKSFILPFIKSKSKATLNKVLSNKYLKLMITDIEEHIETISGRLGKEIQSKALDKLQRQFERDAEKIKDEFILEYYEIIVTLNPNDAPTFEQFVDVFSKPENQAAINQQFEMINEFDIEQVMEILANDPTMSTENLAVELLTRQHNIDKIDSKSKH